MPILLFIYYLLNNDNESLEKHKEHTILYLIAESKNADNLIE